MSSSKPPAKAEAIVRSALWAAYGDALGFMTELVSKPAALVQRTGSERVDRLQPWSRRVGGRFGVELTLPAGTYSDDTQLRLATSRAIRASGRFDVESFSKIELPIFLAYELGGGRGTRAAATELTKRSVRWSNNFFSRDDASYISGGGNGAAMRVQPHVWASRTYQPDEFLADVFSNAICTHGHARAFVGAAWHAISLAFALREGDLPDLDAAGDQLRETGRLPELVRALPLVGELWVPLWEQRANQQLEEAVGKSIEEGLDDLASAKRIINGSGRYVDVVHELRATDPASRGSGMKSAVLSIVLASMYAERPHDALVDSINVLGSDTDTVATMAGALLGAVATEQPPAAVQDKAYIISEAERLARIGRGETERDFAYPDLLKWAAPKTRLDAVGETNGAIAVAGLGPAVETGEPTPTPGRDKALWQWLILSHGQSILIRRREKLRSLPMELLPGSAQNGRRAPSAPTLFDERAGTERQETAPRASKLDLDSATRRAIAADFDPTMIGQHLLLFSEGEQGVEFAVAYAAIIAKARIARRQRPRDRDSRDDTPS
jgi:ADP-ribosylglycohydrolase